MRATRGRNRHGGGGGAFILNGSSMDEMKDNDVVVLFHCAERVKQD